MGGITMKNEYTVRHSGSVVCGVGSGYHYLKSKGVLCPGRVYYKLLTVLSLIEERNAGKIRENDVTDEEQKNIHDPAESKDFASPYPVSRLAPSYEIVDIAKEIARADDMLSIQTSGKLRLLADQIRALQDEAHKILRQTRRDQELHRAECGFQKKPGHVYHFYRKDSGRLMLSLLSPEEWKGRLPHQYKGSYRLENDMSWLPVDASSDKPHS